MKKQAGFTLIELVIVIIILGILAVTAAPKFLNLQDDARNSTLKGLEGALNSAGAMVYSKAVIAGQEKEQAALLPLGNNTDINIVYGYSKATEADLTKAAEINDADWDFFVTGTQISISPKGTVASGAAPSNCFVSYTEAIGPNEQPIVTSKECQ